MTFARKRKGVVGERVAEAFLVFHGFKIIERNWRCKYGEIDLIVKRRGEYRFVEVKYRTSSEFGLPELSVTPTKLQHIANSAECFIRGLDKEPKHIQIDVIAIRHIGEKWPEIHWIQGVF